MISEPTIVFREGDTPVYLRMDDKAGNVMFTEKEYGKVSQFIEVPADALWNFLNVQTIIGTWTPRGEARG